MRDTCGDRREVRIVLSDGVGDVVCLSPAQAGPKICQIRQATRLVLGGQEGCLAQREGLAKLAWSQLKHGAAMCCCHREHQIGSVSDPRCEMACDESGWIPAQRSERFGRLGMHLVPDHSPRAGAGGPEVWDVAFGTHHSGQPFSRGRSADVAGADK